MIAGKVLNRDCYRVGVAADLESCLCGRINPDIHVVLQFFAVGIPLYGAIGKVNNNHNLAITIPITVNMSTPLCNYLSLI